VNKKQPKNFDLLAALATALPQLPFSGRFLVLFFKQEPLA
jgi:hypothetical protein